MPLRTTPPSPRSPAVSAPLIALIVAAAAAAFGCAAPTQGGSIEVRAGAIERLEVLCRFRRTGAAAADLCGEEEPTEATAKVEGAAPAEQPAIGGAASELPAEAGPAATGQTLAPHAERRAPAAAR